MKKWLFAVAALPLLTGIALAKEPVRLTDGQMDKVTAGFVYVELFNSNVATTVVATNFFPSNTTCPTCDLFIGGPASPIFTLAAQFNR
jgi:hypothetical protein